MQREAKAQAFLAFICNNDYLPENIAYSAVICVKCPKRYIRWYLIYVCKFLLFEA